MPNALNYNVMCPFSISMNHRRLYNGALADETVPNKQSFIIM